MFDESDAGVVIADGRSGLRLTRVGEANELGYPTLIEVRAGPFAGVIRDDTVSNYSMFLEQLELLYRRLSGTATLGSYEGFSLTLEGGSGGGIGATAVIIGEHVPSIRLTFEFSIDQSYLPPIIRGIRREFPEPMQLQKSWFLHGCVRHCLVAVNRALGSPVRFPKHTQPEEGPVRPV